MSEGRHDAGIAAAFPFLFRTALTVKNLANWGKITAELLKVINFSHFLGKTFGASKKCY